MEAPKPKGFGKFDSLMRKLVKVSPKPRQPIGPGICDGCGQQKDELFACDGAPLAGGAICADCLDKR